MFWLLATRLVPGSFGSLELVRAHLDASPQCVFTDSGSLARLLAHSAQFSHGFCSCLDLDLLVDDQRRLCMVQMVYVSTICHDYLSFFGLNVLKAALSTSSAPPDWSGSHIMHMHKSRRRMWMQEVDRAGTYENFLKIRVIAKDVTKSETHTNEVAAKKKNTDGALPPLKRSNSLTEQHLKKGDAASDLPRNRSFSGTVQEKKKDAKRITSSAVTDPLVQEELGE
jgi:hypothetical protein